MTMNITDTEMINKKMIDYHRVDEILEQQREIAKNYLKENIMLNS